MAEEMTAMIPNLGLHRALQYTTITAMMKRTNGTIFATRLAEIKEIMARRGILGSRSAKAVVLKDLVARDGVLRSKTICMGTGAVEPPRRASVVT
jgi:hypothetical protein